MASRTTYLGRLLGLYAIVVALAMITYKQETIEIITSLLNNATAMFAVGLVGVAAGLALVLAHNVWTGGALPVVVTLVGWWSLIKGLACLFLPQQMMAGLGPHYDRLFYVSPLISLLLGLYLVYATSFRPVAAAQTK
jgi:hypothetical protein